MKLSILKKIKDFLTLDVSVGKTKNFLFENIATMLASGIDIETILTSLEKESKAANIKRIIAKLKQRVENGDPVWKIFSEENFLGDHLVALVRIGERTGTLPRNLDLVVKYKQRENEFSNKIKSASLYPGFVLVLLIAVGVVMIGFVLPKLTTIYESFKVELPLITRIMIAIGKFFENYGVIAVPVGVILIATIIYLLFSNKKTKFIGDYLLFKTPIVNKLLVETEVSRFGLLLNNLLECGISPSESLRLLAVATSFRNYQKLYTKMAIYIDKGYSFNEIFLNDSSVRKLLPLYARELVLVGEKTGKLPESLKLVGETYEKRNEVSLKDAGVIFEPILLIMVWGGIAFVAVAVILPLYNIIGSVTSLTSGTQQAADVQQQPAKDVINDPTLQDTTPDTTTTDTAPDNATQIDSTQDVTNQQ